MSNQRTSITVALFILFFFISQVANGQAPSTGVAKADPRVAAALKETATEHDVSSRDGDYKVTFQTSGKRTQLTHIASATEQINGVEMRIIFSFASVSKTPPSQQTANMLLQENMGNVGTWALQKLDDGSYAVVNLIYVPATAGGKQLQSALMAVATLTDEMEEKLTKKDVN